MQQVQLQFEVSLKSMKIAPAVGPNGSFARTVPFGIHSPASHGTKTVDGGLVGEETLRRCELLEESGAEVVTVTDEWLHRHSNEWQTELVNLALKQVAARN